MKKTMLEPLYVKLMAVVVLSLMFVVANAQAQVDSDNDGFTDLQESAGITLADGTIFPSCPAGALVTDPCVHQLSPDLFVILTPASPTLMPANPLAILLNLTANLGVHRINSGQAATDRTVSPAISPQKAVSVTESLDTNATDWGRSPFQGTPNSAGLATVFTQRIKNAIASAYQQAGVVNLTQQQADTDNCVRQVTAHEIGHGTAIASVNNSRYGGNHYSTSSQVVMSQTATITTKPGKVTIICPNTYASPDATSFKLK